MLIHRRQPTQRLSFKPKKRFPEAAKPRPHPTAKRKRLDYNLKPLEVGGLAHYIELPRGNERFRVY